jgi:hypothetical protein
VLVVENVLPDAESDPRGQTLGVRERTPSELGELVGRAGFGPLRVFEATAI